MSVKLNIEYLNSTYKDPRPEHKSEYPKIPLAIFGFVLNTVGRIFPTSFAKLAYNIFSAPRTRAKHKRTDALLEQAKSFEFVYGKRPLKGYEWGSGNKVVLLVHGWESRGTALRGFVPELLEAGYRVVTFDGPAHGDSEGTRTNILHFGGSIKAIIEHIDGTVEAAITHSFGGAAIVYMLANMGQAISIDKLALISASSSTKKTIDNYLALIHAPPIIKKHFYKYINDRLEIPLEAIDVSTSNSKINVKTALIVHDELDPVTPISEAKAIANSWNDTTLVVTKGYGHYRIVKNPDVVNRIVSFIITK